VKHRTQNAMGVRVACVSYGHAAYATHCTTQQHTQDLLEAQEVLTSLHYAATRCNAQQHNAAHILKTFLMRTKSSKLCNTLQNAATRCNALQHTYKTPFEGAQSSHDSATRCNTLQHAAKQLQHTPS